MTATVDATSPVSDLDPFSDEFLDNPYPGHEALREAGPAVWLERYGIWAVARHAQVERILRDPELFCSARGVGITDFAKDRPWRPPSLLLETDPPEHNGARRAVAAAMAPRIVRGMTETFTAEAERMVDDVVARGRFDGVEDLAARFPLKVFPDQVGLPVEGREHLLPYGAMVFNGFGPQNDHFESAMAAGTTAREWIMAHTRLEALSPDGLGAKIHAVAADAGFDGEERALLVRSFLSAGVDTTVHGLGNALLLFAQHPDQFEKLRSDPALARNAFEEVIRLEAPVQTFFRTTTKPVDLEGVHLGEGSKVLMFYAAANRDPRRWERPEEFDITRRANGHMGYGNGIHACVGQALARLEGEIVLKALAQRVKTIELDGAPTRQLSNTLRGLHHLPLRVTG